MSQTFSFWGRRGTIDTVIIDPRGRWLVAAGRDAGTGQYDDHGDVKLYDARTGQVIHKIAVAHRIRALAFSLDGATLATGFEPLTQMVGDNTSTFLFFGIGEDGGATQLRMQHIGLRHAVCFGAAAGDGQMVVWSTPDWKMNAEAAPGLQAIACEPCSSLLAVASVLDNRSVVRIWDVGKAVDVTELLGRPPLVFLGHSGLLAYRAHDSDDIMLFDCVALEPRGVLPNSARPWRTFRVSRSGRSLAALDDTGLIPVWDLSDAAKEVIGTLSVPRARAIAFALDENYVAVVTPWGKTEFEHHSDGSSTAKNREEAKIELWDVRVERVAYHFPTQHDAISTDGSVLATYIKGAEEVDVWDITEPRTPKLLWKDRWRTRPWSPFE